MAPVTRIDQFIVAAVTSLKLGQKLKKNTNARYMQAKALFAMPSAPGIFQGPQMARTIPSSVTEGVPLSKAALLGRIAPVQRRYRRRQEVSK
jgi:hypothetical protein